MGSEMCIRDRLGGFGAANHIRLNLDESDSDPVVLQTAALEALQRWRTLGADPIVGRSVGALSEVVARTCEGIWAQLNTAQSS